MADITTPLGFFSNTIQPVFNENIFSQENLGSEVQKPNLTSPLVLRDQITKAASDKDISLTEFDASANLARQTLLSDLTNSVVFTRNKRDLEFNVNAEKDIQLQQGRQLLADIDAFTESQRAIVQQREYEKELKRQEELLKEQKKEELELMAMQLGIDPTGASRKNLKSSIASAYATRYKNTLSKKSGAKSGTGKCDPGYSLNILTGKCQISDVETFVNDLRRKNTNITRDEVTNALFEANFGASDVGYGQAAYDRTPVVPNLTPGASKSGGSSEEEISNAELIKALKESAK